MAENFLHSAVEHLPRVGWFQTQQTALIVGQMALLKRLVHSPVEAECASSGEADTVTREIGLAN